MKIGILYSRIRIEEKLLVQALEARGAAYDMIDVRHAIFDLDTREQWLQYDVILERCVSHSRAQAALQILGSWGIPCVNNASVAKICGDKLETNMALIRHNVPTPQAQCSHPTRSMSMFPPHTLNAPTPHAQCSYPTRSMSMFPPHTLNAPTQPHTKSRLNNVEA